MIVVVLMAALVTIWTMANRSVGFRRRAAFHAAQEEQRRFYYEVETECLALLEREIEVDLSLIRKHQGTSLGSVYLGSTETSIRQAEESRAILRAVVEQIDHHAGLKRKYERASLLPWVSVSPDPLEPPWPHQGELPLVFGPTMVPGYSR